MKKTLLGIALTIAMAQCGTAAASERTRYDHTDDRRSHIGATASPYGYGVFSSIAVGENHRVSVSVSDVKTDWYDYNSVSLSYDFLTDTESLRAAHYEQSNDVGYTTLSASKTLAVYDAYATAVVNAAHLTMDGYETFEYTAGGYLLKNIVGGTYATIFAYYGQLESIRGFSYSDNIQRRIGATLGWDLTEDLHVAYEIADERIYGSEGISHMVSVHYDINSWRATGFYYTTSQMFVEDGYGVGISYKY